MRLAPLLLAACTGESRETTAPTATPSPQPTAAAPPPSPTQLGTLTPQPTPAPTDAAALPPVEWPGPASTETIPIDFGDAVIQMLPWPDQLLLVPTEIYPETTPPLLHYVEHNQLWMLDGVAGLRVAFSPFDDNLLIARTGDAGCSACAAFEHPETVLVDLETREVRRLLPVPSSPALWESPTSLIVSVREARDSERPHLWDPGYYRLDLEAFTVTREGSPIRWGTPSLDGLIVARAEPRDPGMVVVLSGRRSDESSSIVTVGRGESLTVIGWTWDGALLIGKTLTTDGWQLIRFDINTREQRVIASVPSRRDAELLSPDGRYLAHSGFEGLTTIDLVAEDIIFGPHETGFPAGWSTDNRTLAFVDNYCVDRGHSGVLHQLHTDTGSSPRSTRRPSASGPPLGQRAIKYWHTRSLVSHSSTRT